MNKNKIHLYAEKEGAGITLELNGSGAEMVELIARSTEYLAMKLDMPYEELCKRLAAVIAYTRTFETEIREEDGCNEN